MDEYKTIAKNLSYEIKIERSLFIAHVQKIDTEEEAKIFINKIKEEHKQATHNCYAYRIGLGKNEIFYYNDDGEPSGTAGKPIYGAMARYGVTNLVIVVTRYFGGKKLGVRGLIDAYGEAASAAIQEAGIITKFVSKTISLQCTYPQLNQVNYLFNKYKAEIISQEFGEQINYTVVVREKKAEDFLKKLKAHSKIINCF
ncbi:MAG TPA: YigZ family protein [Clostridia bacterium]|nr:YigZ family protein [Clostridia bacterium]